MVDRINKPSAGARIDRSNPLARGLVGAWLVHEGSGGVLADLAQSRGLRFPASASGPAWHGSAYGPAIRFGGFSGQRLVAPGTQTAYDFVQKTASCTVAALVRPSASGSLPGMIVDNTDGTSANSGFMLMHQAAGTVQFAATRGGGQFVFSVTSAGALANQVWTMVVGVCDRATARVYFNARPDPNTATVGTLAGGSALSDLACGAYSASLSWPWIGSLAGVWIWNRPLTKDEVARFSLPSFDYLLTDASRARLVPGAFGARPYAVAAAGHYVATAQAARVHAPGAAAARAIAS